MDARGWSDACKSAYFRPIERTKASNYGCAAFAIFCFAAAALFSSVWFWRWMRLRARNQALARCIWRRFGWLSGLVCAGSAAGVAAWIAIIPANSLYYDARDPANVKIATRQRAILQLLADVSSWLAAFLVPYGIEVTCLTIAKVMVLGRLIQHADVARPRGLKTKAGAKCLTHKFAFNLVAAAVAVCGAVGLAANVAASFFKIEAGKLASRAADECDSRGAFTPSAIILALNSSSLNKRADQVISVQNTSEMVAMIIIVATYLAVVPACIFALRRTGIFLDSAHRRFDAVSAPVRLKELETKGDSEPEESREKARMVIDLAMAAAILQQKRLSTLCLVVFFAFQPRAVFDIIQAIGNQDTMLNLNKCGVCDTCQPVYLLINLWLRYTPEFRAIAVALSSPLPLSVSLWFMLSSEEREILRTGESPSNSRIQMAVALARERMHIDLPLGDPESAFSN